MLTTFRALSKTPGACALPGCTVPARKIYDGPGVKILSCGDGHAEAIAKRLEGIRKATRATDEQFARALTLFNEWGGPRPPIAEEEDDFVRL